MAKTQSKSQQPALEEGWTKVSGTHIFQHPDVDTAQQEYARQRQHVDGVISIHPPNGSMPWHHLTMHKPPHEPDNWATAHDAPSTGFSATLHALRREDAAGGTVGDVTFI